MPESQDGSVEVSAKPDIHLRFGNANVALHSPREFHIAALADTVVSRDGDRSPAVAEMLDRIVTIVPHRCG